MQLILSSKNVPLTSGLKTFVTQRLSKLSKLPSLSSVQVLIDVNRHKHQKESLATVELIGSVEGKTVMVKEHAKNFYAAFFKAVDTLKLRLIDLKKRTT